MKTKSIIRKNVFETNSSSSHSIEMGEKTDTYSTIYPDKEGVIRLGGYEFGWGQEEYDYAEAKASYVAMENLQYAGSESYASQLMLEELLLEHTGAERIEYDLSGYIDHQSVGLARETFSTKEELKDFIFGNARLIIDNDNH